MNHTVLIDKIITDKLPFFAKHPKIEKLVGGFRFVEGPVWIAEEKRLIFSDIPGNAIYSWQEEAGLSMLKPNSYLANGNTLDPYGNLISCEHGTSRITATDLKTGRYSILADSFDGKSLNSPNDVVARSDGSMYFTDPIPGRQPRVGIPRTPELPFCGIYRYDDKTAYLYLLDDTFTTPNGLCFSDDEKRLYVNDSADGSISVFDVDEKGMLKNRIRWSCVQGDGPGCADGMKFHPSGHIFCTGPGGIYLLNPGGNIVCRLKMPEVAANLTFNEDYSAIYVTATSSIYRIRL